MGKRDLIGVSFSVLVLVACGSEADPASGMTVAADAPMAGSGASAEAAPSSAKPASATAMPSDAMAMTGAASSMITSDEMWSDGKMLAANVDIAPGAKVQIAPGAKISVASGVTITVHGSLEGAAKDNHAKLSGMGWMGVVVAGSGSLKLSGVDIEGAKETLHVNSGNTLADYSYGTVTGGLFRVDAGGSLVLDHTAVVQGGFSFVSGSLKATFLDYSGTSISLGDASANVFVSDSKFTGSGADFFTAGSGQLLHVEYSTIDNSHCPFHFTGLNKFEIDHVTTGGMDMPSTSGFGLMIYNSEAGPHSITNSNFNDPQWSQTRPTATINITNTFIRGMMTKAGQVTFTPADASGNNAQMEPNADAHPRGTPGPG